MTCEKRALRQNQLWCSVIACLVGLGILFRIVNLDQSVYWVDEVATSMRVSGYTHSEVTRSLMAQLDAGEPLNPPDLLQFQQIRPDASWPNLLRVLSQSPEHAPLYFLLMRLWANGFGTSIAAMRSLSVVFSLLTLPTMAWACSSLFRTERCARDPIPIHWTATGLLAISPYFVAYAQEARPYSLWALLLLLVLGTLGRSLQGGQRIWWVAYALTLSLCLYTSLLTVLTVLGQGLAVLVLYPRRRAYLLATGTALLALLPWAWIVLTHWQVLQSNTDWAQQPMPLWAILGIWHYSLAVLFFDVPVAMGRPVILGAQVIIATGFVTLMGYAAYRIVRQRTALGWLLVLGALSTPVALLLLDLVRSGQAAATPRYLMPAQLCLLLSVAYCLSDRLSAPVSHRWRGIAAVLLSVSLLSCLIGLTHDSNYQKSRNRSNPAITSQLNQVQQSQRDPEEAPIQLIAEVDHVQDLISLAYDLDPQIDIHILPPQRTAPEAATGAAANWLAEAISSDRPTFLFTPSESLKRTVRQSPVGKLRLVYAPVRLIPSELGLELWRLEPKASPP
ncbi:MAG: hypothetical protein ACFB4J_12725 [Elainellaceae cyanobacterium]